MKLKEKIDHFLWAFMWLLPFLAFLVSWWRIGSAPPILQFIDEQFAFSFISDIFNDVWQAAFSTSLPIAGYLSYLVCVEIAHCLFDVVVFIPRFAHSLVERSESLCQRK